MEADARKTYEELDPAVRRFLEKLDEEDLIALADGIKSVQGRKIIKKFLTYSAIAIFTAFTSMVTLGQGIDWLWRKWMGGAS